jgi:hypothetical protein
VIIDEINGNLAKVLGELITCLSEIKEDANYITSE